MTICQASSTHRLSRQGINFELFVQGLRILLQNRKKKSCWMQSFLVIFYWGLKGVIHPLPGTMIKGQQTKSTIDELGAKERTGRETTQFFFHNRYTSSYSVKILNTLLLQSAEIWSIKIRQGNLKDGKLLIFNPL